MLRIRQLLLRLCAAALLAATVVPSANAASCAAPNDGGFGLRTSPETSGTAGSSFSTTMVLDKFTSDAVQISGSGLAAAGLSLSAAPDVTHIDITISGTPNAGSFPVTITAANNTGGGGFTACSYGFDYTFTFSGGAGGGGGGASGGGGVIEQPKPEEPMVVGKPRLTGTLTLDSELLCEATTFSRTPETSRIYFTKNGVEIPDDAGDLVTSINATATPGIAKLKVTDSYYDSELGCTVYGKAGTKEDSQSDKWGTFYSPSEFYFVLQFSEDELRTGDPENFSDEDKQKQYQDGFVGGSFILGGKNIDFLEYTILPNTGQEPTETKTAAERSVTKTPQSAERVSLQLPETQPGDYYIVARGTPARPALEFVPITIDKPVVTVQAAKQETGDAGAQKLNGSVTYLPPAVAQVLNNLAEGKAPLAPQPSADGQELTQPILVQQQQAAAALIEAGPFTETTTQVSAAVALKAMPTSTDVAVQTKTLYQAYRKQFPAGIKIQFRALSSKLTADSVRQLQKLATLPIKEVSITGYVQKSASSANDMSLSLARAKSVASVLTKAKLKAKISVRAGGVGGKSVASRSVIMNLK